MPAQNASNADDKDLKQGELVEYMSPVTAKAIAQNLTAGTKASFKFSLTPRDYEDDKPIELRYKEPEVQKALADPLEFKPQGPDQVFELKFDITCDPEYKLAAKVSAQSEIDSNQPKDVKDPMTLGSQTFPVFKYAATQFEYCANELVKKHKLFYWWSDHAHYHAVDTAQKMHNWLKYFAEPYYPNGIYPENGAREGKKQSPAWPALARLAQWAGFLHDLGMGANARHRLEIEDFDKDVDVQTFYLAATVAPFLSSWAKHVLALVEYLTAIKDKLPVGPGNLDLPRDLAITADQVKEIEKRAKLAFAKLYMENHKDGVRNRHSLNSTLYCIDPNASNVLRKYFTEYELQKLAMTVCMHSKSKYGPEKITEDDLSQGYKDIKGNATKLIGALKEFEKPEKWQPFFKTPDPAAPRAPDKTTADAEPPKPGEPWRPWGPWLKKQQFKYRTDVDGKEVKNTPQESSTFLVDEVKYIKVLTRAIGVVDNMRARGNKGDFRDNRGVSFKRLPLDYWEKQVLDSEPGPKRVHTGSFRLLDMHDDDSGCSFAADLKAAPTYLEVLRIVNDKHPKLKGLLGDLKKDDPKARFPEVVRPELLNLITFHPDNDVVVPPVNWKFNIGELNISHSEITSVAAIKPELPGLDKTLIVDRIVIASDCDPALTAHIVMDICKEGPRAFEKGWVIVIEKDEESKTYIDEWFLQNFSAPSYEVDPEGYKKKDDRKKLSLQRDHWTKQWGLDRGKKVRHPGDGRPPEIDRVNYSEINWNWMSDLHDLLCKYSADPFAAKVFLQSKDGWKTLEQLTAPQ